MKPLERKTPQKKIWIFCIIRKYVTQYNTLTKLPNLVAFNMSSNPFYENNNKLISIESFIYTSMKQNTSKKIACMGDFNKKQNLELWWCFHTLHAFRSSRIRAHGFNYISKSNFWTFSTIFSWLPWKPPTHLQTHSFYTSPLGGLIAYIIPYLII